MPGYGRYYKNPDITAESLKNIRLPDKIRCDRCNKWKGHTNYSKKRLNDLREKIRSNGPKQYTSQCTLCVPGQVMELKCFVCEKDKGLEDFAKAQRKDPDHARCNDCMKEQLDTEPINGQHNYRDEFLARSDSDDDEDFSSDEEYSNMDTTKSTWEDFHPNAQTGVLIGDLNNLSCGDNDDTVTTTSGGFAPWSPIRTRSTASGSVSGRTVPAFKPKPTHESEKEDDAWGEEEADESSSDDEDSDEEYGTMTSSRRC
ncbi:DNA repair protein rad7 [Neofusicoccum parvum]|nr:DNA repair protein rad7 [Neofusicoccum parvum]